MQMDSGWVRCWFNRWDLTTNHFFDQSSAHGAFAKDALNANETNVKPGGNQCCMHATVIPNDNLNPELHDQPQDMVFPVNLPSDHKYYEFYGQAKGMKVILKEWGLWNHLCTLNGGKALLGDYPKCWMSQKACDALAQSAAAQSLFDDAEDENTTPEDNVCPDELPRCCLYRLTFEPRSLGYSRWLRLQSISVTFLPKFHCELNPIEMYWGWVKICKLYGFYTRNCEC